MGTQEVLKFFSKKSHSPENCPTVPKIVPQCRKGTIPYLNTCITYLNTLAPYLNTCLNYLNTLTRLSVLSSISYYIADSSRQAIKIENLGNQPESNTLVNQSKSSIT